MSTATLPPASASGTTCPLTQEEYLAAPGERAGSVWVVHMAGQTIEVVALFHDAIDTVAALRTGETVTSGAFPGLVVAVDAVFTA